jgi:hypothetical protein
MTTVDLDALRAARREAAGEAPTVTFKQKTFQLPAELPFAVPEALMDIAVATDSGNSQAIAEGVSRALKALFGGDFVAFMDLGPSMQDVQELFPAVLGEYGMDADLGESLASGS